MISISILLLFAGVWCCYQTSHRAELLSPNKLEEWLRNYPKQARFIGLASLAFSLILSFIAYGFGSGIFAYLLTLSVICSLIIILAPMQYISAKSVGLVFACSFILEII